MGKNKKTEKKEKVEEIKNKKINTEEGRKKKPGNKQKGK